MFVWLCTDCRPSTLLVCATYAAMCARLSLPPTLHPLNPAASVCAPTTPGADAQETMDGDLAARVFGLLRLVDTGYHTTR